jgi:hypothetical protein
VKDIITTATAGKSNSSLDAMPMHTTHYGGALASIEEEKA